MSMDIQERIVLICKPEQSGKTFVMIQQIIKDLEEPIKNVKTINIIFCDNNLLLTKQTSERVKNDLSEFRVNNSDEFYLEFSSHSRTKYHCIDSVLGAITYKDSLKNILCCTNGTRTENIFDLINTINEKMPNKFQFKIWLDEADKFIGHIDVIFKPLLESHENVMVYCITATPKNIFDKYKTLNVFPLENTTTREYHGWEDNIINLIDLPNASVIDFVSHVFNKIQNNVIAAGTKWFIPAETKKKTHEAVKDLCIINGFAVIVVNGDGIKLTLPNYMVYHFNKNSELNTTIVELYKQFNLYQFPLAITGNICIGRGISIMSNDFMIDYAILCYIGNHQEVSQISGRLKGNIKHWNNYKKPIVYTTEPFNNIAKIWENKSRKLAIMAFDKQINGQPTIITKAEFKTLGEDYEYIVHNELFNSFKEAQGFLKRADITRQMRVKPTGSKKGAIHRRLCEPLPRGEDVKNGYALSSKLGKIEELTQHNRITYEQAQNPRASGYIGPGQCISSTDKGSRFLILPVYETLETSPNKEKYQVRYISFK